MYASIEPGLRSCLCPCCHSPISGKFRCRYCGHVWHSTDAYFTGVAYATQSARNALPLKYIERKMSCRLDEIRSHIRPGMHVLEVGCAEGELGRRIKALVPLTYWGIEPSRDAEIARQHLDVVFPDSGDLPGDMPPLDAIISFHVLEHIPDIGQEMGRWRMLLKMTGWLLVEVPLCSGHPDVHADLNPEHLHHFTWASLACLLERTGFEIISMSRRNYESPTYSDSLRVIAVPRTSPDAQRTRLLQRFSVIPKPFAVFGLGGDFRNYVQPILEHLQVTAFLDNNPALLGTILNGFEVESYSSSRHAPLPILVCSIRHEESIITDLRQKGHPEDHIYTLADIYDRSSLP